MAGFGISVNISKSSCSYQININFTKRGIHIKCAENVHCNMKGVQFF